MCASLFLAAFGLASAQGAAETTAFPGEEYIAFAISTIDQNCEVQWLFESAVSGQGAHGVATAGQAQLPDERCPGKLFPFAIGRYKWTMGDPALQDSFVLNVKFPDNQGGWQPVTVPVKRGAVEVKSVNMENGTAVLNLNAGKDTAGTVTLDFETAGGFVSSQTTTAYYQAGPSVSISIDRPKIKKGQYSKLKVTWNTTTYRIGEAPVSHALKTTYTPPKAWNVLGVIRYSQYAVTNEAKCTGVAVQKWVADSVTKCNFSQSSFKSDFLEFADINGTGKSSHLGYVKPAVATSVATTCADKLPPNVPLTDIYVQVSSVTGACNTELLPEVSVATVDKKCVAKEILVRSNNQPFQKRDVDDQCKRCKRDFRGTDGHIDAFVSNDSCDPHDFVDLGNYWTLQQP